MSDKNFCETHSIPSEKLMHNMSKNVKKILRRIGKLMRQTNWKIEMLIRDIKNVWVPIRSSMYARKI